MLQPPIACKHNSKAKPILQSSRLHLFRLLALWFGYTLLSVVKLTLLYGLHNYVQFSTNKSLALRYCPHNTLDNTLSLYTSSLHERQATTLLS